MNIFCSKNSFLTFILMAGIILNLIWSMRLEIEAARTRSLIDEHHASLERNSDELARLKRFYRSVGENDIDLQDQGIYITSGKYDLGFSADNYGIRLNSCSRAGTKNCLPVELSAGSGNHKLKVTLDPQNGGMFFVLDKTLGYSFDVKGTNMQLAMDPINKAFTFQLDNGYGIGAGKTTRGGRWITLQLDGKKSVRILENQGIAIENDEKPIYVLGGQSVKINSAGNIDINARGNINLQSEKGIVKINGKRILLNE